MHSNSNYSSHQPPLDYPSSINYYSPQPTTSNDNQQQQSQTYASYPQPTFHSNYNIQDSNQWNSMASTTRSLSASHCDLSGFEDEAPLLEELGINPKEIWQKTLQVSIPFRTTPTLTEQEADLAGPLVFCLLLGCCLLLTGKLHFGYIYGFGLIGCFLVYFLLSLMSDESVSFDRTMSILGYSLLPIVVLAATAILLNLRIWYGFIITGLLIAWSTLNAVRMFETALSMKQQRYLIAYPIVLLYSCFALLTIF